MNISLRFLGITPLCSLRTIPLHSLHEYLSTLSEYYSSARYSKAFSARQIQPAALSANCIIYKYVASDLHIL